MKYPAVIILSALLLAACGEALQPQQPATGTDSSDWDLGSTTQLTSDDDMAPASEPQTAKQPRAEADETTTSPSGPSTDPRDWREFERQVVELVNARRAAGADCGEHGWMEPAGPLTEEPHLRASAVGHSKSMAARNELTHESADGSRFWDRAADASYGGIPRGEDVAGGYATPEEVVEGWMTSDGHCYVAMLPEVDQVGVGYVFRDGTKYGHFWTMDVGISRHDD